VLTYFPRRDRTTALHLFTAPIQRHLGHPRIGTNARLRGSRGYSGRRRDTAVGVAADVSAVLAETAKGQSVGSPFGTSASVRDDGTQGPAGDLIGYTIVEADNLAAAKAFADGLPFLSNRDGKCAVDIFELLPM